VLLPSRVEVCVKERQAEGSGFPAARHRAGHHVTALQGRRDGGDLNRSRFDKLKFLERAQQLRAQAEIGKHCHGRNLS
jgi:hypothetical protein